MGRIDTALASTTVNLIYSSGFFNWTVCATQAVFDNPVEDPVDTEEPPDEPREKDAADTLDPMDGGTLTVVAVARAAAASTVVLFARRWG